MITEAQQIRKLKALGYSDEEIQEILNDESEVDWM